MKKLFILGLLFLGIFTLLFFAPQIIIKSNFQKQVVVKINHFVGVPTEIGEISLHWLPFPYLLVRDIKSLSDNIELDIPELQIIPAWESLFKGNLSLGKLKLIDPTLTIKSFQFKESVAPLQLAGLKITIKNGTIISPDAEFSHHISTKKTNLSDIQIDLTIRDGRFKFNITGRSDFCEKFTVIGRVDLGKKYYRIDSKVTNLNLADLIKAGGTIIQPTSKKVNLSLFAEGMTLDNFKIILKGDIPSFRLKGAEWFTVETNSCQKLSLHKYGPDFFIHLDDLQLISPALHLNGSISKKTFVGQNEPIWDLDLAATKINLSQARNLVLKEWGNNIVAKEVCAIILGGKAHSAKYLFQGSLMDFHNIEDMKILVDVADAKILIPHIGLLLDSAKGKIAIVDGRLTGNNLSATIGNSTGEQGEILLDLRHGGSAFNLDLNLDVDGARLREVLSRIIINDDFQQELRRFSNITGRAKGHLSLGDSLHDIQTNVEIDSAKISGMYDRLPWPFNISSGHIDIAPQKVVWADIGGDLGPHIIKESTGAVDWQTSPYLDIVSLDGDLALNKLLNEGSILTNNQRYELRPHISKMIDEIWGRVAVDRLSLSGPALQPGKWQYSFACQTDNLTVSSPLFPELIQSDYLSGNIDNERVQLNGNGKFFENHLNISANYAHTFFSQWSGTSSFTGLVGSNLMNWFNEITHIPNSLALRAPINLERIKFTTSTLHPAKYRIAGRLSATPANVAAPYLQLNIDHQGNSLQTKVDFISQGTSGSLHYNITGNHLPTSRQYYPKKGKKNLRNRKNKEGLLFNAAVEESQAHLLSWNGSLDAKTLELFLFDQPLKSGNIKGSFTIKHSGTFKDMLFSGDLEADNVVLQRDQTSDYPTFKHLKVAGLDKSIFIEQADIIVGDYLPVNFSGLVTPAEDIIKAELKLTTDQLSSIDILKFADEFKLKSLKSSQTSSLGTKTSVTPRQAPKLDGRIEFAIKKFDFLAGEEDPSKLISFTPLQGIFSQNGPKSRMITLRDSKRCGIIINGNWLSDNGTESSNFILTNSEGQNFQTTLPCLGADNSIIEGDIELRAELSGYPGKWKNGKITLRSSCGIIRKMDLLSKIFSLINFTEIFAFNDLPNFDKDGLLYNDLFITGEIKDSIMEIETATLKGKGLNISAQGTINLDKSTCSLTLFIAPFKMVDSVVTSIPLIGKIVGGKKGAILTFPVRVEGKLDDPTITPISPTAIGKATFDFIKETLALPFTLFSPVQPEESPDPVQQKQ